MRLATVLITAAFGLVLAGCEKAQTPTVAPTDEAELLKPSDVPTMDATKETELDRASVIPTPIQGRWGLVAADCTSTRGDAKGLLEIDDTTLRFYESRGVLGEIANRTDRAITAAFAFTGEGQAWSRDMTLTVEDAGKTLIRRESGEGAAAEPLKYTRCT